MDQVIKDTDQCVHSQIWWTSHPQYLLQDTKINALLFDSHSKTASDAAKDTYEKLLSKGHVQNSDDQSMDNTIPGDSVWSKRAFINKWTCYINFKGKW